MSETNTQNRLPEDFSQISVKERAQDAQARISEHGGKAYIRPRMVRNRPEGVVPVRSSEDVQRARKWQKKGALALASVATLVPLASSETGDNIPVVREGKQIGSAVYDEVRNAQDRTAEHFNSLNQTHEQHQEEVGQVGEAQQIARTPTPED